MWALNPRRLVSLSEERTHRDKHAGKENHVTTERRGWKG